MSDEEEHKTLAEFTNESRCLSQTGRGRDCDNFLTIAIRLKYRLFGITKMGVLMIPLCLITYLFGKRVETPKSHC